MNLRQKAKNYKRMYERYAPKKPYPVVFKSERELNHYKPNVSINMAETYYAEYAPELVKYYAVSDILAAIRPIITEKLKEKRDIYTGNIIYSVDIWI